MIYNKLREKSILESNIPWLSVLKKTLHTITDANSFIPLSSHGWCQVCVNVLRAEKGLVCQVVVYAKFS